MRKDEHQKHERRVIRDEIKTSAAPQQAWEAWADPAKISQWFVDRAEGKAEAGGDIKWFFDKFNMELRYKVLEAVPGERFAILWPGPMPPPGILEVIIEREGGETLIRLVNSGFREDAQLNEEYEGVVSGWHSSLAILREYVENYFGQPRSNILAMQPAQFEFSQVARYFREPELLAKWLTKSGSIGDEGDTCKLVLRSGESVTGRVISRTQHEVAVSWPAARAALELKSFSMGPQRMLGIRGSGWSMNATRATEIEKQMTEAVARLAAALQSESASSAAVAASDAPAPFWNAKKGEKS
jgi:uncharacterized protein YndB with AHSA1/START domain